MLTALNTIIVFRDYVTPERVILAIRVVLILLVGIPLIGLIRTLTRRLVRDRFSAQSELLIVRAVYYAALIILFMTLLNEFGFKLSALLGAAGIFGIAVGFASQTSVSNIISGIFLISEKPFIIGDTVQIGSTIGAVESIDLLSIKLRTSDNRFVRVPNETMIKTEVINITRFPVRRVNLNLTVSFEADLNQVRTVLLQIAQTEPLALAEPAPVFQVENFADSGIALSFGVWGKSEDNLALRSALLMSIKDKFSLENIRIPYPHLTLSRVG